MQYIYDEVCNGILYLWSLSEGESEFKFKFIFMLCRGHRSVAYRLRASGFHADRFLYIIGYDLLNFD